MAVSSRNQQQFTIIKNKTWSQTAESGDTITYEQNTLDTHVTISHPQQ